jgi:hypothetical protein
MFLKFNLDSYIDFSGKSPLHDTYCRSAELLQRKYLAGFLYMLASFQGNAPDFLIGLLVLDVDQVRL